MDTILIVDDDAEWRATLSRILSAEYSICCAANGDEALTIASRQKIRIIILDVMMPGGKDGFSTLCAIHQNPQTKGIPVIIVSSVNQATDLPFSPQALQKYLGTEPFAFLEKPVVPAQLLKTIRAALQSSPCANGARSLPDSTES